MSDTGALLAIAAARKSLTGANYDLNRSDKHPNDVHKATVKIESAIGTLDELAAHLRGER